MDQRKGDPRIYIVTLLFLSCIVSGGVLLGLYLLLPDSNPLFLQAGMFLVGVPWLFWFLAYVYSCVLKPCTVSVSKSVANFDPEKGEEKNNKNIIQENAMSASDPVAAAEPMASPREGEKHVQFGNVVVLGDEEGRKEEDEEDRNEGSSNNLMQNHTRMEDEDEDREQENQETGRLNSRSDDDDTSVDEDCDRTPLRLSIGNK
ncbi:hypothetical protein EUTSA_v10015688mg [Eutrema salsugineum]|uniref:Uncharacterized protein n=1 Tax=Eutrema salsugineum TaxID=72664 RepID=V4LDH4_EUTSA|nr:uncharacterized protein LOC18019679 [Eutrema salsugineum]ESQ41754.1 hypothetical protein EUTSA_v10015688mg [Eutrema salsugineum]